MFDVSQAQADQVLLWKNFYMEFFKIDLNKALFPEPNPIFDKKWLIIRDPSFTAQNLLDRTKKLFDVLLWTGRNLDTVIDQRDSVRSAADWPYGIWVEPGENPDEDLRGICGYDLKYLGVTLEERLLLEMFYWWRTKSHLDDWYRTLCSGTTYDNGGIPCVGWDKRNDQLIVDCNFFPAQTQEKYCVRKVIALPQIPQLGVILQ